MLTATRAGQAGEFGRRRPVSNATGAIPRTAAGIFNAVPEYPCMKPSIAEADNAASRGKRKRRSTMMTSTETERLTSLLRAKQTELSRSLHYRDEIVIEKASDALDEVQLMEERELAIRNLDRDSNALRLIYRALLRIANGTYGVCLHCEEDILPKRMTAVPWAAFCIQCQEKIDRREIEVDETVESLAPAA